MKKDNLLLPILIGICFLLCLIVINVFLSIRLNQDIRELENYLILEDKIIQEEQKIVSQKPKAIKKELVFKLEYPDEEELILVEEVILDAEHPYAELIANLTEYELEEFYTILYAEAGGESIEGQRAATEVILNRMLKRNQSMIEVLSAPGQFTTWECRTVGKYNNTQIYVLQIVATADPILPDLDYIYFGRGIARYMNDPIKIENHWFGAKR